MSYGTLASRRHLSEPLENGLRRQAALLTDPGVVSKGLQGLQQESRLYDRKLIGIIDAPS